MVVGDGVLRENFEKEALKEKFSVGDMESIQNEFPDILLTGSFDNPYAIIARSQILLFPSRFEGFPMVLCEAMICRTLILSSDCPTGPREILSTGSDFMPKKLTRYEVTDCGYLLPIPENEEGLEIWEKAILDVFENPGPQSERVSKAFNSIKVLDTMEVKKQWFQLMQDMITI